MSLPRYHICTAAANGRVARSFLTVHGRLSGLDTHTGRVLLAAHRFHSISTTSSSSSPSTGRRDNTGKAAPIIDAPAPPRPAFYVPPEQRASDDESLAFMQQPESPLRALEEARRRRLAEATPALGGNRQNASLSQTDGDAQSTRTSGVSLSDRMEDELPPTVMADAPLGAGQQHAPTLPEQRPTKRHFMDADAERLQSTSVHAGHSLLKGPTIDSGDYTLPTRRTGPTATQARREAPASAAAAHNMPSEEESFAAHAARHRPPPTASASLKTGQPTHGNMFRAKLEDAQLEDLTQDPGRAKVAAEVAATAAQKPRRRQLEEDIKKLEYYFGSPQYPAMLEAFRNKYGKDGAQPSLQEGGSDPQADSAMGEAERAYSSEDVERGLASQPVDYLRSSAKLQTHLTSGPHAYDPVTVMQQHGLMRFQGYAFPPSVELGKLKGIEGYKALQETHKENAVVKKVRQSFNALMRRQSDKDDFLATDPKEKGDTSLIYRTVGLDAVQRRQMRFMLTDFDYADRHTAFHVMMTYPYTDWLHAFYMVLVGWALYQLQVKYNAYDFYDEYLGLDLRQVPSLKKPFLIAVTCSVMVFLLFQPLLVASIATNRAYRIVTRRPIGPP